MKRMLFMGMLLLLGLPRAQAQNPKFRWAKGFGGDGLDECSASATDATGNIYTVGNFTSDTVDFDPGPGVYKLGRSGSTARSSYSKATRLFPSKACRFPIRLRALIFQNRHFSSCNCAFV